MFGKRIFLARNEKKYKYGAMRRFCAQSTLEYALIFPVLFLLILGIMELAFMWHEYNSVELAAREISANIAVSAGIGCVSEEKAQEIVLKKTAILQERALTFNVQNTDGVMSFTSNEQYKGKPFVVVKIDCSPSGVNGGGIGSPSVQVQAVHRMRFFIASLPNLKTGERIVIIPDNFVFVSTKVATLGVH